MVIHRGDNGLIELFWNRNAGAHIFSDINSPIMRASYNGYYPSFPSWRREFDSHRPLTIKKGNGWHVPFSYKQLSLMITNETSSNCNDLCHFELK